MTGPGTEYLRELRERIREKALEDRPKRTVHAPDGLLLVADDFAASLREKTARDAAMFDVVIDAMVTVEAIELWIAAVEKELDRRVASSETVDEIGATLGKSE